ncbi:MAG: hypothetical protein AAFX99_12150, partial [Myxococcota bacterium]
IEAPGATYLERWVDLWHPDRVVIHRPQITLTCTSWKTEDAVQGIVQSDDQEAFTMEELLYKAHRFYNLHAHEGGGRVFEGVQRTPRGYHVNTS